LTKVAIITKNPTSINWNQYFPDVELTELYLSETIKKKLLVKDITLKVDKSLYDYVITVGAEPTKYYNSKASVVVHQGYLLEDGQLPIANPAYIRLKPEGMRAWETALENINKYIRGEISKPRDCKSIGIQNEEEAEQLLQSFIDSPEQYFAIDTETTAFYARKGALLGVSLAQSLDVGYYIDINYFSEKAELLLGELLAKKTPIFHNAKFDMHFLMRHLGVKIGQFDDTMVMHYLLDENDAHGLKPLTIKYGTLGDYDRELDDWKREYCRKNKVKITDFTYDLIPFSIMKGYAALDAVATFELHTKFQEKIDDNFSWIYSQMKDALVFLRDMEDNGVPFSKEYLLNAQAELDQEIFDLYTKLYEYPEVKKFEDFKGIKFNTNSVQHKRILLFDILRLPIPSKKTGTGEISTDAEVMEGLAEFHPLPALILKIAQSKKIKSTYIDKVLLHLDRDGRLRTGFNLTTTTSGRLSSSGTLNMQQLPRDRKEVKRCIRAREGYKIVSQDLSTAEMYVAAVLSGDKALQKVFSSGGDFHSSVAHMVFKLPCDVSEVKELFPKIRQGAKAVSFGILFGASPEKIASEAGISLEEAKEVINQYFKTFHVLDKWLKAQKKKIKTDGFIYSHFGRKRRLLNVFSDSQGIVGHDVRSGVNFLIQSVASDINLFAATELNQWLKDNNMKTKILALVHDSIIAEVYDTEQEVYIEKMKQLTQANRGVSIPGYPIGLDVEIGNSYAFDEGD